MSSLHILAAADAREFAGFPAAFGPLELFPIPVHWSRRIHFHGASLILVANGAGAARARRAVEIAAATVRPNAIWNVGFCGALDPALQVGDIVTASKVIAATGTFEANQPSGPAPAARGVIVSIDRVAQTLVEKSELRRQGAAAVEMEASGIAQVAGNYGVPFYCVRAVSDLANEAFACDFNAAMDDEGRFSSARLAMQALRSPWRRLPELVRLAHRTSVAAGRLGRFLAECRY